MHVDCGVLGLFPRHQVYFKPNPSLASCSQYYNLSNFVPRWNANFSFGNDLCFQQRFMNSIEFHNLCRGLMFICLLFWSYNLQQVVTSLNNVTSRRKTRWCVSTTANYVIHVFGFVLLRMYCFNRNSDPTPSVTLLTGKLRRNFTAAIGFWTIITMFGYIILSWACQIHFVPLLYSLSIYFNIVFSSVLDV